MADSKLVLRFNMGEAVPYGTTVDVVWVRPDGSESLADHLDGPGTVGEIDVGPDPLTTEAARVQD